MSVEILTSMKRKARKPHACNYCGQVIPVGETYNYAKLKSSYSDGLYEWKSHEECSFISSELWCYIDPDEGMTEEDFRQGCTEFCQAFICPGCDNADNDEECCNPDYDFCVDKIYKHLQTHEFKRIKSEHGWTHVWKCVPKGDDEQ